jgi:hypothetical protein
LQTARVEQSLSLLDLLPVDESSEYQTAVYPLGDPTNNVGSEVSASLF